MYKVLDKILNQRLWKELKQGSNSKIDIQQTGFRAKLGTEINIIRILDDIRQKKKEKKQKTIWTLFIDLKSAFDRVDHKTLMRKLRIMDISEELVNTIEWFYEQTKIKVNEKEINIGRGVI